jgi:uncharacterized membrane protein (GlpM family)
MGTKSVIRIVLSAAVIAGYFLPWISYFNSASAFDIVRTSIEGKGDTSGHLVWYASILIPLFALICLIQSLSNRTPSGFIRALPFIITILLIGLLFLGSSQNSGGLNMESLFSMLGIGFYITLVASFLLIFIGRDTAGVRRTTTTTSNPM